MSTYGINKFNGKNLMKGTLTADFGKHLLKGSIVDTGKTLTIGAKIKSDASFTGKAKFNGSRGTSQGHFFGKDAASLAGIAEFKNKNLNTAFGGTKNK